MDERPLTERVCQTHLKKKEAGRPTSLQPATVPAQGHLYQVAGGMKQKGLSDNAEEIKRRRGKKRDQTLEH